MVVALHIADRNFAGERAEQIEVGAELRARAIGVAVFAENIDLRIVNARILVDLDERLEAGIDLVADA